MTDFFDKKPSAPPEAAKKPAARKPSGSKPVPAKKVPSKKKAESDDDDELAMGEAVARNPAPRRAATTKAKQYIEIDSGSDDDDNDDMFEDD